MKTGGGFFIEVAAMLEGVSLLQPPLIIPLLASLLRGAVSICKQLWPQAFNRTLDVQFA